MGRPPKDATKNDATPNATNRFSFNTTPDGQIDWAGMRPSTRSRLRDIVDHDTDVNPDKWGITNDPENEAGVEDDLGALTMTQADCAAALDALCATNGIAFRFGAARFIKHPLKRLANNQPAPFLIDPDIIQAAFTLTEKQHKQLDPRLERIARKKMKNAPEWVKKNMDLIMLGSLFLKATADNAKAALQAQFVRDLGIARKQEANAAATNKPVDTDAPAVGQPTNGHDRSAAQPGSSYEGPTLEPGETSAIDPESQAN